jgi:hypothetical protein
VKESEGLSASHGVDSNDLISSSKIRTLYAMTPDSPHAADTPAICGSRSSVPALLGALWEE